MVHGVRSGEGRRMVLRGCPRTWGNRPRTGLRRRARLSMDVDVVPVAVVAQVGNMVVAVDGVVAQLGRGVLIHYTI